VTGNETPNRPSVAGTASEVDRNNARYCHQERFADGLPPLLKPSGKTVVQRRLVALLTVSTISVGRY